MVENAVQGSEVERAKDVLREFEDVKQNRSQLESDFREIAERLKPEHAQFWFGSQAATQQPKQFSKKHVDVSGVIALERFVAIFNSISTPFQSRWHLLKASDPVLNRKRRVQLYFDEVTSLLFKERYASRAGFAEVQLENYESIGLYGNGAKFVDAPFDQGRSGLRYIGVPFHSIWFRVDIQGRVDGVFRRLNYTPRQAAQQFDVEKLPEIIQRKLDDPRSKDHDTFEFIHFVGPQDDDEFPFESVYVSREGPQIVDEGGFRSWPFPIGRYTRASGSVYATGPAMKVLGSLRTADQIKIDALKAGQRATTPVLLAKDDDAADWFNLTPGAVNGGAISEDGKRLVDVLPSGNPQFAQDFYESERRDIADGFLTTLFSILTQTPEMTATEVVQRTQEQGALLSPVMSRQQTEDLGPMIERELELLAFQGMLPEMPPEMEEAQGEFEIEFASPLALSQRAGEVSGFMRLAEFALNAVQLTGDSSHIRRLNFESALPEIAEIQRVPARWLRSNEEVEELAAQDRQQQQVQQAADVAPAAAGLLKQLREGGGG